nr:MAG TPA: hypothetical protein [Caudoviricetes sp.]
MTQIIKEYIIRLRIHRKSLVLPRMKIPLC